MVVPLTPEGERRLAVELAEAHRLIDPPALVWVFDTDALAERRGALYAWRAGAPVRGLVVRYEPGRGDLVEWVCSPFVRARAE